ncbi:uncharacterized protein LOC108478068 [Gossypium arboreum]|uniref:uncharacterized protein LOC108478068 n=1 Tax=Gossypium arboreum TaxID=29729 RepID=UPI000819067B|nr:uncharacterized protein LOC108478068 [Gossypium arboreum]
MARHVRCLLCHACRSPTPWTTGSKVGYNVFVCDMCVNGGDRAQNDDHKDEEDADSNDDDAHNQVVPWCSISNTLSSASTSSGGEREIVLSIFLKLRAKISCGYVSSKAKWRVYQVKRGKTKPASVELEKRGEDGVRTNKGR